MKASQCLLSGLVWDIYGNTELSQTHLNKALELDRSGISMNDITMAYCVLAMQVIRLLYFNVGTQEIEL